MKAVSTEVPIGRPVIGILYILNYIDRQNLSAANVQGIMVDLDLTTEQFATAISILFGTSAEMPGR